MCSFFLNRGQTHLENRWVRNIKCYRDEIGSRNYKIAIKTTFWGGFAVDADFGDGFSGSIEGPQNQKKPEKSINFILSPGGGSGPKHSAFCGACFSINPYRAKIDQKCQKSTPKNREPSVFFKPQNDENLIKNDPHKMTF
jgi:hypothetical protein